MKSQVVSEIHLHIAVRSSNFLMSRFSASNNSLPLFTTTSSESLRRPLMRTKGRNCKHLPAAEMAVMGSPRVFVVSIIHGVAKHVKRLAPTVTVEDVHYNAQSFPKDVQSSEVAKRLQEAEILLCDRDALLTCVRTGATPKLAWAQTTSAGVDFLMREFKFQKPPQAFTLARIGQGFGELMAEYVIGHIIAREKDFAGIRYKQEQKEWDTGRFNEFRPLWTLSIGILGYGAIGKKVSAVCKALGMTVWAVNRSQNTSSSPNVDHFRGLNALGEVLQNCDYVCNILPSTRETDDLLSGDVLKHCQERKSVFINIGRGRVINDDSLLHALREGWIGGAILDVFNKEPLPTDSELWSLPNVVITPHVSGPSMPGLVARAFVSNLNCYMSGQPLQNVVNWDRGY